MRATLSTLTTNLEKKICSLREDVQRINDLVPNSMGKERKMALAPSLARLEAKKQQLRQTQREVGLRGWAAPIKFLKDLFEVRHVQREHNRSEQIFDAPEEQAALAARIAAHNQYVTNERGRLNAVMQKMKYHEIEHATIVRFSQGVNEALIAVVGDAWRASDFSEQFLGISAQLETGDVSGAMSRLPSLVFQRQPSKPIYERLVKEANDKRDEAYTKYAGVAASGAYNEIAANSIELARNALRGEPARQLGEYVHAADQWQVLSALLTDPRNLNTDALWAIYWAMFQCGALAVPSSLAHGDAHEDVITGKLTGLIDHWLSDWAKKHISRLGYPDIQAHLGILEIASTKEEARLGADIGLIVDLDIGDLSCRKIALFQVKKAKQGYANLNSVSRQLLKLASQPKMGYYLFYHQSPPPLHSPSPTVCSARTLVDSVTKTNVATDANYRRVNVRTLGWDWASFVSFGLCQAASDLGESFVTPDDALDILGGGDTRNLPRYLHIIAIADGPRITALRGKVDKYYDSVMKVDKRYDRGRHNSREIDEGGRSARM